MKLAILLNSDVMEKNQCQIRIQRPKISTDLLVSSNAQIFVAMRYLFRIPDSAFNGRFRLSRDKMINKFYDK